MYKILYVIIFILLLSLLLAIVKLREILIFELHLFFHIHLIVKFLNTRQHRGFDDRWSKRSVSIINNGEIL